MNLGVLVVVSLAIILLVAVVLPRVRGLGRAEATTVERRSGGDRRRRRLRVPIERRQRARRTEDVARAFVERVSS